MWNWGTGFLEEVAVNMRSVEGSGRHLLYWEPSMPFSRNFSSPPASRQMQQKLLCPDQVTLTWRVPPNQAGTLSLLLGNPGPKTDRWRGLPLDLHVNKGATDHFFAMGIGKEKKQSAGRERGRTGAQRERERGGEMGLLGPQRGLLTSFVSIHGMFQDSGQPPHSRFYSCWFGLNWGCKPKFLYK